MKKPSYEELQRENILLRVELQRLKEEIGVHQSSGKIDESYYSNRFFRITENVNDIVYRLKLPEGKYEYISPQVKNLFGYSSEEISKSPILIRKIIHPDHINYFMKEWRGLLKGQAPDRYEIKIVKRNGDVRWILQKNLVVFDKDNKPVAIEGVVTDITEQKMTEEALINSEAQKNAILNNLPHLAWLKDCDGKYLSVNDSFAESLDKTPSEVVGKTDYDLYDEDYAQKSRDEDMHIILMKKQLFLEQKKGDTFWETVKAPVCDNLGNVIGLTGMSLEISRRKKVEEEIKSYSEKLAIQNVKLKLINDELVAAKEKAEESDKLKSAFLANMSHEIRTPMNAILGFATLLKNRKLPEEKVRDFIDLINSNSRQLLRIITDIIDISKIEAGQISIFNKNFNLNKAMSDLHDTYVGYVKALKKPIEVSLKKGLPDNESIVFTDKVRLEQILSNLMSNAVKFTDRGKVEMGYYINRRQDLVFYVKDSGIGMTTDEQKIVFERFRQVGTSYNKVYGGTGLGLSISKGLAERLGGKIWIESTIEKGSTFYFNIPYKPGVKVNKLPDVDYKNNYNWSGKTILIAEDEHANYTLLETLIMPTKAKIVWAKNGFEAVSHCMNNKQIDLVLMDIKMPVMNGVEAAKKIKKLRNTLPIIAQTAYAMSTDEENCRIAGCDDYFAKPLRIEDILDKINKFFLLPQNPTLDFNEKDTVSSSSK